MDTSKAGLQHAHAASTRMQTLLDLAQQAARLGQGALKERVAVPSEHGGYTMVVREIKNP